jgi:hypothetical protein
MTQLALLGGIFVWTALCFYWKAGADVSESAMWWLLIVGYLVGFYIAFGVVPDLKGDPIEMSIRFLFSGFGLFGLAEAALGAILGDKLGSKQ